MGDISYYGLVHTQNHQTASFMILSYIKKLAAMLRLRQKRSSEEDKRLERFVRAQKADYATALREVKNGKKESHWIWYIFPILKGLVRSPNHDYYDIDGAEEAMAYYDHPVLGQRLREISTALLQLPEGVTAKDIFARDAKKVQRCMSLFYLVTQAPLFKAVLDRYYGGKVSKYTKERLENREKKPLSASLKKKQANQ